jgi:hypothetical protein
MSLSFISCHTAHISIADCSRRLLPVFKAGRELFNWFCGDHYRHVATAISRGSSDVEELGKCGGKAGKIISMFD